MHDERFIWEGLNWKNFLFFRHPGILIIVSPASSRSCCFLVFKDKDGDLKPVEGDRYLAEGACSRVNRELSFICIDGTLRLFALRELNGWIEKSCAKVFSVIDSNVPYARI